MMLLPGSPSRKEKDELAGTFRKLVLDLVKIVYARTSLRARAATQPSRVFLQYLSSKYRFAASLGRRRIRSGIGGIDAQRFFAALAGQALA
jgi:hypothetical protein